MYPTEEQIRIHNEEAVKADIASTAMVIVRGLWDYDSFSKAVKNPKYKSEVDEMIRHYLSLPQYKHLPVPKGFEM